MKIEGGLWVLQPIAADPRRRASHMSGVARLSGAPVKALDIRRGAAMLIAPLGARGRAGRIRGSLQVG